MSASRPSQSTLPATTNQDAGHRASPSQGYPDNAMMDYQRGEMRAEHFNQKNRGHQRHTTTRHSPNI
jgi:hypothetical protein